MPNNDPVEWMGEILRTLEGETVPRTKKRERSWESSPLCWLAARWVPPGTKGAAGREIVKALCRNAGLDISPHRRKDYTKIRVREHLVSVKFSLLGENNKYLFQNIKKEGYEFLFCLGVSPKCAHAWVIPIERILNAGNQHGNADKWINSIDPDDPPSVLRDCGQTGDIDQVCDVFRRYLDAPS